MRPSADNRRRDWWRAVGAIVAGVGYGALGVLTLGTLVSAVAVALGWGLGVSPHHLAYFALGGALTALLADKIVALCQRLDELAIRLYDRITQW